MAHEHGSPSDGSVSRGLAAHLVPGPGGSAAELVIEYDGLEPPLELFAELAVAGWTVPVPVPPPSDAIDWTRPDPLTGKRYSVRPYRATARSRPQSRVAFTVDAVRELVERHCRAPQPPAAHPVTASPPVDRTGLVSSIVIATLPPERVDELVRAHPLVEVLRRTPTNRRVVGRYRGRESEMLLPVVEVELRADAAVLRSLLQSLHDVDVQVHPLPRP